MYRIPFRTPCINPLTSSLSPLLSSRFSPLVFCLYISPLYLYLYIYLYISPRFIPPVLYLPSSAFCLPPPVYHPLHRHRLRVFASGLYIIAADADSRQAREAQTLLALRQHPHAAADRYLGRCDVPDGRARQNDIQTEIIH